MQQRGSSTQSHWQFSQAQDAEPDLVRVSNRGIYPVADTRLTHAANTLMTKNLRVRGEKKL